VILVEDTAEEIVEHAVWNASVSIEFKNYNFRSSEMECRLSVVFFFLLVLGMRTKENVCT
jgi:hypothetical protein